MKFFNRKEEVLDIQLTQYGKHLLSAGELKPEFYAFFDDDILYDGEYADVSENQNDIAGRIKETPRPKVQYMFQSADKSILELRRQIEIDKKLGRVTSYEPLQPDIDKHYVLSLPVGTSGLGNQNLPAWEIESYGVEISSSSETWDLFGVAGTPGKPKFQIPQIDIDVKIRTIKSQPGFYETVVEYPDGSIVAIEEDHVLLEVFENNGLTQNEEFELEVYQIDEEYDRDGTTLLKRNLMPLRFKKQTKGQRYIVNENNKVIPNPEFASLPPGSKLDREIVNVVLEQDSTEFAGVDVSKLVEYYFDVELDREVDPDLICKKKPIDRSRGRFARTMFKCREEDLPTGSENIYSNLEEPEEVCDD